jgi:hypothetical protein
MTPAPSLRSNHRCSSRLLRHADCPWQASGGMHTRPLVQHWSRRQPQSPQQQPAHCACSKPGPAGRQATGPEDAARDAIQGCRQPGTLQHIRRRVHSLAPGSSNSNIHVSTVESIHTAGSHRRQTTTNCAHSNNTCSLSLPEARPIQPSWARYGVLHQPQAPATPHCGSSAEYTAAAMVPCLLELTDTDTFQCFGVVPADQPQLMLGPCSRTIMLDHTTD